jgi:hypothetical protein
MLKNAENLRTIAAQGCIMSQTDYDGRSALHLAAAEGHLECVKVRFYSSVQPVLPGLIRKLSRFSEKN